MVGNYPIRHPVHGGQRRARAIYDAYGKAGMRVGYAAVVAPGRYRQYECGPFDIRHSQRVAAAIREQPLIEDLLCAEGGAQDERVLRHLRHAMKAVQPNVVQFEQPWMWPAMKIVLSAGLSRVPRIIYSSHNVEAVVKAAVMAGCPADYRRTACDRMGAIESDLAAHADAVIAVAGSEAAHFRQIGAKRVHLVRNGSDGRTAPEHLVQQWAHALHTDDLRYAAFVASGHIPNVTGFANMIGSSLAFLPPNIRIVAMGSVCHPLSQRYFTGVNAELNRSRLHLVFEPADADIAAILQIADLIILPITSGGGSNLKTAEALLSQHQIVATSFAFRSFEEFMHLPRVSIEDDPTEFRHAMVTHLRQAATSPKQASSQHDNTLASITWPYLGQQLVREVSDLCAGPA
jgi:hypothetical protein